MKKSAIITITIVVLLVLAVASIPLINNYKAYRLEKELLNLPLPEKTEVVESFSKAGKLVGNGNGMQYLGAMLVRSDLSFEDLKAHYAKYEKEQEGPFVKQPKGQTFDIANSPIQFSTPIDSQNYYIVYLWGFNDSTFLDFDVRGH